MKKRVLSIILAIMMIATIVPMNVFFTFASDKMSFEDFAGSLVGMIDEYDTDDEHTDSDGDFIVGEDSVQDEKDSKFELKRLIVKAKGSLNDMGAISKVEGYDDLHIFQYATEEETEEAYNYYLNLPAVEYVDIDAKVKLDNIEVQEDATVTEIASDEYKSWGIEAMGIPEYKEYILDKYDASELPIVTVAVLDSGINAEHEMFGGYYDPETNPNGRILKNGYDFCNDDNDPNDDMILLKHGTHVSGTIAESTLVNVKIMPIKITNAIGYYKNSTACLGMEYAIEQGANIVNMSLGGSDSKRMKEIIDEAYDEEKTLFVVAAGNNDKEISEDNCPANIEKCITVAAVNEFFEKAYFSDYGNIIDVTAPGANILSAGDVGEYEILSGTSQSAPHVTGLIALFKTYDYNLTIKELEKKIKNNTIDLGEEGFDKYYGYGFAYTNLIEPISLSFDKDSGEYDGEVELKINCSDPDAKVYYTLDGTKPTVESNLYEKPIMISKSVLVSAIACKEVDGKQYTCSISSNLVTILIKGTELPYEIEIKKDGTVTGAGATKADLIVIPSVIDNIQVKAIGKSAFLGYNNLRRIKLPNSIKSIGASSFRFCSRLENVIIPNGVEVISFFAFADCYSLENITIPSSVENIRMSAFYNCNNLKKATIISENVSIGISIFGNCNENLTIYGKMDSTAFTYAIKNNIKFVDIDAVDDFIVIFKAGSLMNKKRAQHVSTHRVPEGANPSDIIGEEEIQRIVKEEKIGNILLRFFFKPTGKWKDEDGNIVKEIKSGMTLYADYKLKLGF